VKTYSAFLVVFGAIFCCAQTAPAPQVKRIHIEERLKTSSIGSSHCDTYGNCYGNAGTQTRNVSLELTRELTKRCPSVLTVTDNRDAADFDLRISTGSSTLYKQNGDVAYISPAKFKVSNLAKDICNYVATQH
jgi:hypothetical protein